MLDIKKNPPSYFLVPKLHLGTHLSAQFHCPVHTPSSVHSVKCLQCATMLGLGASVVSSVGLSGSSILNVPAATCSSSRTAWIAAACRTSFGDTPTRCGNLTATRSSAVESNFCGIVPGSPSVFGL